MECDDGDGGPPGPDGGNPDDGPEDPCANVDQLLMQDDPLTLEQCQMLAECIQAQNDILFGTGIFNTEAGQAMVAANVASNTALSNAKAAKKKTTSFPWRTVAIGTLIGVADGATTGFFVGAVGGSETGPGVVITTAIGSGAGALIGGGIGGIVAIIEARDSFMTMLEQFELAVRGQLPPGTAVLPNGLEAVGEAYQQAFQNFNEFVNMIGQQYQNGINRFMEECPGSPFGP